MKELKDEIKNKVGKPILIHLGRVYIVGLITAISFPFVWLWVNLWVAIKVSLTGFMLMVIFGVAYNFVENEIQKSVDDDFDKKSTHRF